MKAKEARFLMLKLQLFAEPNTQTTDLPGMSVEMKTYYSDYLIEIAGPELVHDQFADTYDIPKNGGKTIEFRKYDNLKPALTPLTEGVTPNGNKLNVTKINSTVDQYGDYITLSDMLTLTAIDNNVIQATKKLGSQAGLTLDCITRDVLCGGTAVFYANGKTSRSQLTKADKLDRNIFFKVAAYLKKMHAPKIDGSYVAIIHPSCSADIMMSDGWIDITKYKNPEKIYEGEIGKIAGIRFVESSNAKVWRETENNCPEGLAVYSTIVVGSGAYGTTKVSGGGLQTIIKQLGAGEDPLNQRATVGWKATKTTERLVEQYMVRIESCSDESENEEAN